MRHLVLAVVLASAPLAAMAQVPESPAESVAMTTLLRVCLDHAAGEPAETLVRRAQSGGFVRQPDGGGVLGESLTWQGEGQSRVRLSIRRAEALTPALCRIEVSHGDIVPARLSDGVVAWATATSPAFGPAEGARDMFDSVFGPKPESRTVLRRPGARLTVERFPPPTGGFDSLFADQAVTISLERMP
jgi:hypothetical protein